MKKSFLALVPAIVLCIGTPIQTQAAEIDTADKPYITVSETNGVEPYAEWIITNHSLSCSAAKKAVKITAKTSASSSMDKIGFKDIVIQKSTDNVHWSNSEEDVDDMLKSSASVYYLSDYSVSVNGGYYYRVKLTHYAKESGLFGGSQSVENTSNSVWVD